VKLTLDRQKILGERRPRLTVLIGEAALRQMRVVLVLGGGGELAVAFQDG
jgi:hypothetical protein